MSGPTNPEMSMGSSPLFTSRRERRLWAWTASVVVAIYATVGLARVLAEEFRRRDLLDAAFVWAFVLILLAIVALGLRLRPGGLEIGVALGVVAVYALMMIRIALPEERTHVIEYGVVALLAREALLERRRNGSAVPVPSVLAAVFAIAVGTIDEVIQLFVPSRVFDPIDIFTNAVSAGLAVASAQALAWARKFAS